MAYLNRVTLIGNLGQDPEIKSTQSGNRFANISIATTEKWKDKNSGEQKERTQWHRIVVWNEYCVKIAENLKKGNQVYVEGQLETRSWETQNGEKRYATEVVLRPFTGNLHKVEFVGSRQSVPDAEGPDAGSRPASLGANPVDDDIPF
jgi:single-strand DNA-binding protein